MSLHPCRECGHEVSDDALACPHCGCAHPAVQKSLGCGGWVLLFAALAMAAAVIRTVIERH
ncbi:MAG: hypothetical protein HY053_07755 [Proteobacteria bacterium]|nr:hypothetical protein [Pseudomonadota bacterium]